ncbi:MAG: HK97 family phage prohead protease [Anaerovoracaceae bacterium]
MPIRENREYRNMPVMASTQERRFETEQYVEGFATTFNEPYVMFRCGDIEYKEVIDKDALRGADLSDVIFQYNHKGRVYARNKMRQGKPQTLLLEPQEKGLFVAADLSSTEDSRKMFDEIDKGLIYQMSWGFTVEEDSYNVDTHTRTILKIKKVYDVSAVDLPANEFTDISARSWVDGVIEQEERESLEREKLKQKIRIRTMIGE